MDYLYIVPTNKEVLLTVRITESVREEFKKVAELRGSTMSGLMHQFIVMTIRQEKIASPHEFRTMGVKSAEVKLAPVVARIEPSEETKIRNDIRRTINGDDIDEIERRLKPRKKKAG